jgi:hypothetical protein
VEAAPGPRGQPLVLATDSSTSALAGKVSQYVLASAPAQSSSCRQQPETEPSLNHGVEHAPGGSQVVRMVTQVAMPALGMAVARLWVQSRYLVVDA